MSRDHVPNWFTLPHLNLKKIRIEIHKFGFKEVEIISCLLHSMPSLQALEIQLSDDIIYDDEDDENIYDEDDEDDEDKETTYSKFLKDVRCLERGPSLERITIVDFYSIPIEILG